jgi:hypothetical protein
MYENTSRKNYLYLLTPAETAIVLAIAAVESAGADPRLTDAINLLSSAKDKVAEFVDDELFGKKKS